MKILGSDFDGTLTHGGIGRAKLTAIAKWRGAGHKFGIVSGRGGDYLQTLRENYPKLELDFFAACNGGYILGENGELLYAASCCEVSVIELVKDLFAWGCPCAHINGKTYMCAVSCMEERPLWVSEDRLCLPENLPTFDYFYQVSVQLSSVECASEMTERIRRVYGQWLNPLQNNVCIDIVPKGVDKAQGLYRVMEFYGCSKEDVIAVGDNINDADMIREFRSYAMANGVDEIKRLADEIVSDVTELLEKEM